jgi:hypothetical protein
MADLSGYFFMDGMDLWVNFGLVIERGSADFLRYPPKKESITHDWLDSNGVDVDLSRIFFQERQVTLACGIIADSEEDFWLRHDSFIATLTQPGLRRLMFKSHGDRQYFVYYKDCSNYTQIKALKGQEASILGPNKVAAKFSLIIEEPNPFVDSTLTVIVDEDGRYLTT